ncbi:DEKNAAC100667 [Brettanomyces naardenensis]|uniref:DEKNAAC100667 n=1 Tax=Brettanomyces naardenensis TaxID=13370 RepID=A0A448YEH9_BRENA|nr:DEKNAAC100667 [Brettanomyces naardenensis]
MSPAPYPLLKKQKIDRKGHSVSSSDGAINQKIDHTVKNTISDPVKGPLDPVFGQHRAFPISIDTSSIDPHKVPENVSEYLAHVRLEAQDGALFDEAGEEEGFYYVPPASIDKEATDNLLQGDDFMSEYIERRDKYAEYRSQLTELNAIELPKTHKEWKYFIFNNEPTYAFVAQILEESEHIKLIVYFTKWLNTDLNEDFEKWLFLILEAIDKFLDASDLSVLRGLAKKAKKQTHNELDERNKRIMIQILSIVGKFYGQRDLL